MINHIGTIESDCGSIDIVTFMKGGEEVVQVVQGIGTSIVSCIVLTKEEAEKLVQKLSEDFI